GYAIDITQSGSAAGGFGSSDSYAWLAADNYLNAKRFGFVPSYPPDTALAGPEPEPWEWVYVGVDELMCSRSNRCRTPAASPAFRPI
ncbi:MAG: D-alanyl-D-alanine carboxypeptidase family protein, partial [Acidimicrobiia bacterium]